MLVSGSIRRGTLAPSEAGNRLRLILSNRTTLIVLDYNNDNDSDDEGPKKFKAAKPDFFYRDRNKFEE